MEFEVSRTDDWVTGFIHIQVMKKKENGRLFGSTKPLLQARQKEADAVYSQYCEFKSCHLHRPVDRHCQKHACLRCQAESKAGSGRQDCVVVWGECNHSFHYCCMSLWVKQNNRCPLCQQEWSIQRMGK
ncbi:hypothetical protein FOCC_FOCC003404 [Frankliniella occidentalis]|nr:hypothetical protein FOCC_FOCC003404 [Frankliniella occidentalis]